MKSSKISSIVKKPIILGSKYACLKRCISKDANQIKFRQ